jgi:phosphatidylglycerol:prolipoprotein diacylglycerol transferase
MQPFSILLGLGALFGLLLIVWQAPQKEASRYLDAGLWTLLGALVGSRVLVVLVNINYYQSHPGEIVQVWLGGLSGIGALAGGLITILILSVWWKMPFGKLADMLLPLAGCLAISAWLGCWIDRCSYGIASTSWMALPSRDEWGVLADRVPVQLMGAIFTLVIIWVLDWAGKRISIPGLVSTIGLFGLSAVLFSLSFLRADPTPVWKSLRLEAWGAVILMITSLIILTAVILRWKFSKKDESQV